VNPLAANLIRTYIPILVGAVASWLAARGIQVPASETAWAVAAMTGVFASAYYTIVRVLEERFPELGAVLLLSRPAVAASAQPFYDPQADDETSWPPRDDEPELLQPAQEADHAQQLAAGSQGPPAAVVHVTGGIAPQPPYDDRMGRALQTAGEVLAGHEQLLGTTGHLAVAQPVVPEPLQVRKADTGEIPAYRRPPGR
jgi:hypothetical protein